MNMNMIHKLTIFPVPLHSGNKWLPPFHSPPFILSALPFSPPPFPFSPSPQGLFEINNSTFSILVQVLDKDFTPLLCSWFQIIWN